MDKILYYIKRLIPKKVYSFLWPLYHFFLGVAGNIIYRWPSHRLIVIGVTGTTGKTTTTYLIAKMLEGAGYKVGYTSTAMFGDGQKEWLNNKKMTMVGRFFTFKMMRAMVRNSCQFAVIETSSEGIVQYRHRFVNYDIALITGLYPEHIESHGSFENYKEAKGMLFAHLKDCKTKYIGDDMTVRRPKSGLQKTELRRVKKTIIANAADEHAGYYLDFWAERKFAFWLDGQGFTKQSFDDTVREIAARPAVSEKGTELVFAEGSVAVNLLGAFNLVNSLAALSVGLSLHIPLEKLAAGLSQVRGVPGRLERVDAGQDFTVIVDYAFEPRAVEKLYETVDALPHARIIHLLGSAGGGRDQSRRAILGDLAGRRADIAIITDEDPYDEDPLAIIAQVAAGAEKAGKMLNESLFTLDDRRAAIAKAFSLAQRGDIVLITGKGSEQAICRTHGRKEAWDDRVVCREELAKIIRPVDK